MKIVIIGGNAAGMSAASQIKRRKPDWQVVVLEKGLYNSYASCGIPYYIGGQVESSGHLIALTPEAAINDRGIDLRMQSEVLAVNPEEKTVVIRSQKGETQESYDRLVFCTGALSMTQGITFTPGSRIFTIKDLADGVAVMEEMEKYQPRKCAVVGGGYIAVEMLEAFKMRGIETHLIHRRPELAKTFEKEISDLILKEMDKEGIILNLKHGVEELAEEDGQVKVHTSQGVMTFDMVLIATGVVPNSALAKDCGVELGVKGSIKVNKMLQTNLPDIYAAGDCTETRHLITEKPAYVPLALKANKEGSIVGANICGDHREFPGILGTAITKFYNLGIARTGLTLGEAQQTGFDAFKYGLTTGSRAGYYPGGGKLQIVVVAEKGSGRVLGAQMAGPVEAMKRIDVFATVIQKKMTLQDTYDLDLSYAPPFGGVFDPVLLSARVGLKKV